ncbi:unnamed protein product [Adineta steineri]|uniref:Uncharacterized protein n=1 Tax=Adineta steineri TaxID=433720 RepID=A0A818V275_9BILA|nr:unnamed protein product [Adineta steineri]CAF3706526.1 unnamed protein product [Adineta steineri]
MSLALHGHHILLIATLAFTTAVLTLNWYENSEKSIHINVFQICSNSSTLKTCRWIFSIQSVKSSFEEIKIISLILTASFAITCVGISLIGLLFGSWYIQRRGHDNESRCLIVLTMLMNLLSFLFSCGVWTMMLTTNLQQESFGTTDIRLKDFGFSFWINIGSSVLYLYALIIYLIAICKN